MPNIATLLKSEITRLARKEVRAELDALKKSVATVKASNVALKRHVADLEKSLNALAKAQLKAASSMAGRGGRAAAKAVANGEGEGGSAHRFSAKGLASNRKRLGLSAADYGRLVGATGHTIYAWEAGKSVPRAKKLEALSKLRGLGKREVAKLLAEA